MTKRDIYLKALRNEKVDQLVWVPNFDYWLHVNEPKEHYLKNIRICQK